MVHYSIHVDHSLSNMIYDMKDEGLPQLFWWCWPYAIPHTWLVPINWSYVPCKSSRPPKCQVPGGSSVPGPPRKERFVVLHSCCCHWWMIKQLIPHAILLVLEKCTQIYFTENVGKYNTSSIRECNIYLLTFDFSFSLVNLYLCTINVYFFHYICI